MRTTIAYASILAAAWCAGCAAPALHHLGEEARVDVEGIVGTWISEEGEPALHIEDESGPGTYAVRMYSSASGDGPGAIDMRAHTVRIGDAIAFDVTIHPDALDRAHGQYGPLFLPVHHLGVAELDGDTLLVQLLNGDWMEEQLAGDESLAPTQTGETTIAAGSPDALRALMERALHEREDALGDSDPLYRLRMPAAAEGGD